MALTEKGFDDLIHYFEGMNTNQKNKLIKNAIAQGAGMFLQAQKEELTASGLHSDVVKIKETSGKKGVGYKIGLFRGGKDFSDPSSPNFDKYRGAWFHYFGFVTLKKWDKSKRKHPDRKYKPRITKPIYHAPDLWLDRAYDKEVDKVAKNVEDAILQMISAKKK